MKTRIVPATFARDRCCYGQNSSSKARPESMLARPMKRIWPSLRRIARSNTLRQDPGLKNGRKPSTININAPAANAKSQKPTSATVQFLLDSAPPERIALKKSPLGSSTITSPLLRKLARYASRLR